MAATITIARAPEPYPAAVPTGYAVGFHVALPSGRAFYVDTVVPLATASGTTDLQIVQAAWLALKGQAQTQATALAALPTLAGAAFTPSAANQLTGV